MERRRNDMDRKWTDSCPTHGNNPFLLHIAFQSWLQRIKAKIPFPQFLLHHGRDNPHYKSLLWKYQRVGEPDSRISVNILVSSVAAQWMNKDRIHVRRKKRLFWVMCPKLLLSNLVDDQRLGKHLLLIQPWVKSKRSVYWMHVKNDTLLIGGNGRTPRLPQTSASPF